MTNMILYSISYIWFSMFFILMNIMIIKMHPIIMMFFMITLNILMCLILSIWNLNYIYSILTFLIMISGLLIIFMYFSSIISNEFSLFNWFKKIKLILLISLNLFIMFIFMFHTTLMNLNFYSMNESNPTNFLFTHKNLNITNILLYPLNNLTIMCIIFLMLSFTSIIKINSSSHSYSIRKL